MCCRSKNWYLIFPQTVHIHVCSSSLSTAIRHVLQTVLSQAGQSAPELNNTPKGVRHLRHTRPQVSSSSSGTPFSCKLWSSSFNFLQRKSSGLKYFLIMKQKINFITSEIHHFSINSIFSSFCGRWKEKRRSMKVLWITCAL